MSAAVYGACPVKRRRRTSAELSELDDLLLDIAAAEHPLTVRRAFYSATTTGMVAKTEAGYSVVQRRLLALRRAGRMPYSWIADNTRYVYRHRGIHDDVEAALDDTAALYRRNLWRDQLVDVQLFTEKEALVSVVNPVAQEWQLPLGVMRGCASESFIYEVAADLIAADKPTYFYQLGDHDPTGVMAWSKFAEGVRRFAPDAEASFERLAVTPEQITTMGLPTRPTKTTDSRAKSFVGESVEVDAIPAPALRQLVRDAIEQHIDPAALDRVRLFERSERDLLTRLAAAVVA